MSGLNDEVKRQLDEKRLRKAASDWADKYGGNWHKFVTPPPSEHADVLAEFLRRNTRWPDVFWEVPYVDGRRVLVPKKTYGIYGKQSFRVQLNLKLAGSMHRGVEFANPMGGELWIMQSGLCAGSFPHVAALTKLAASWLTR